VDAPPTLTYLSSEHKLSLQSKPFHDGVEHFIQRPSYSDDQVAHPIQDSILENLVFYWSQTRPPSFNHHSPSLLSITYYPLKIVAAEWVRYIEVLELCMKHYEYSAGTQLGAKILARLDSDLRDLQAWVRRCMQTVQKLQSAINFVELRATSMEDKEYYNIIAEDYKHIIAMVRVYSHRLEALIPFVASLVQIVDSRESLREASNVRRLTNLALVFIPLSFVTGLFSMNDGISAHGLVLFFSVAVPLCIVVVSISRMPSTKPRELLRQFRRARNPQTIEAS
jgi:Mg2+ and Co2+ transporter CorA